MKKKILVFVFISFFLSSFTLPKVEAQECGSNATNDNFEKIKEDCERKINQAREQANTLSSQIKLMDSQMNLTLLKIKETEDKIITTQKEIENITSRIEGLDTSLDYLSKTLLKRVVDGYKKRSVSVFSIFFDSDSAGDLLNRIKYQKTAQENNQKLIVKVQELKNNFEEQKKKREEKKIELDSLNKTLIEQKNSLISQKKAKENLLAVTQNDEKNYQRLLDEARRQLSSFRSFTQSGGGGVIGSNAFGSGSDGWYYSQRDERWAGKRIGYSNETVLDVGCLLTDIAMIMKKYGSDMTPADIAGNTNYFFASTAYMLHPSRFGWPNGLSYSNIDVSSIKDTIASGRPVIAGVYAGAYGTHYVVLKANSGDDYIMHDPYYGPDKKFSEHYSKSSIFIAGVFR
jgi:peptidoglycan hydrolase CwlO-like protein